MKVGITLPNSFGVDEPQQAVEVGIQAERLGFDSAWVMDHLFTVGFVRDRLEDKPYWHPLGVLTALSVQTTRITLGTSVMVLPYHNPVEMAKYVATLDHFSKGRVVLGVGAGALVPEFEALGVPTSKRGVLTDEAIRLMRELWTNPDPSFQSERWSFSGVKFSPKPYQDRNLPIWVGGGSPGAKRRAARLGDAWHPNAGSPEEIAQQAAEVRAMADREGRDGAALGLTFRTSVNVEREGSGWRAIIGGQRETQAIVDLLAGYREVGVEHLVLAFDFGDMDAITQTADYLASEVKPHII